MPILHKTPLIYTKYDKNNIFHDGSHLQCFDLTNSHKKMHGYHSNSNVNHILFSQDFTRQWCPGFGLPMGSEIS